LDKVCALRPVRYKWKHDNKPWLGFIAQEMNEVMPELAPLEENPEDMMGIDLTTISTFLVKAIQEQQVLIKQLTDRIAVLEAKLNV
jgi:hypothetical protein